MGLDMYLDASKFLYFDKKGITAKIKKVFPNLKIEPKTIVFEVGYWRKANAIHKWFVDNVQSGNDNCERYYVSVEKLIELKEICELVLKNRKLAKTDLPVQEGFFFGTYEYDDWYFQSLKNTIKIIKLCIKLRKIDKNLDFEYQSSW